MVETMRVEMLIKLKVEKLLEILEMVEMKNNNKNNKNSKMNNRMNNNKNNKMNNNKNKMNNNKNSKNNKMNTKSNTQMKYNLNQDLVNYLEIHKCHIYHKFHKYHKDIYHMNILIQLIEMIILNNNIFPSHQKKWIINKDPLYHMKYSTL